MINKAVFKNKLAPFNDIKIKKIYKDKSKKFCYGQVTTWVWERKGTQQFWLEMLPEYRSKKDIKIMTSKLSLISFFWKKKSFQKKD